MTSAPDNRGIILLGMPRSGTTLLKYILNSHPRIACGAETFLFRATARFFSSDTVSDGIDYGVVGGLTSAGFSEELIRDRVRRLAFSFLEDIAAQHGKPRWAAKTAMDSFYIPEIEKLYGAHARFVCVTRHALDAVLSLQDLAEANETHIAELHDYIARYPRPLEAYAHAWCDVTRDLLDFAARHSANATLLRYEDLVSDPEAVCERIFDFLGEAWDPNILEKAMAPERIDGIGDWKIHSRPTIDSSSVGRWKTLRQDIVSRLGPIVNPLLVDCDYDPVPVEALPDHDRAMRRYEMTMRMHRARANPDDSGDT